MSEIKEILDAKIELLKKMNLYFCLLKRRSEKEDARSIFTTFLRGKWGRGGKRGVRTKIESSNGG